MSNKDELKHKWIEVKIYDKLSFDSIFSLLYETKSMVFFFIKKKNLIIFFGSLHTKKNHELLNSILNTNDS